LNSTEDSNMVASPSFTSTLNVNAPAFVPSWSWNPTVTDEYYDEHPLSPGSDDFGDADSFFSVQTIPDDELFDAKFHPLTPEELLELEQVDEINAMLADLELREPHQELHSQVHEKLREMRTVSDVDAELLSLMAKPTSKHSEYVKTNPTRLPKKKAHYHVKKNAFAGIQQPRSVK